MGDDLIAWRLRHSRECPTCKGTGRLALATLSDPCPYPDVAGWTMQMCFSAKRCACQQGVLLGYTPAAYEFAEPVTSTPTMAPRANPIPERAIGWGKDEFGNPTRIVDDAI